MFTLEAYTLQEKTTIHGKIITAGELVVKAKYFCSMQIDTNWYWNQQSKHHVITVTTHTILHTKLEVNEITDFHEIPTSICSRTQEKKPISRQPICLTDSDYDYILEEIGCREKSGLKDIYKFIVMTRKINIILLNEYYMYLLCIFILTIIRFFFFSFSASIGFF